MAGIYLCLHNRILIKASCIDYFNHTVYMRFKTHILCVPILDDNLYDVSTLLFHRREIFK